MLEKRGSDKYMVDVLADGSKSAMLKAYLELHHTDPDEATLRRAREVFYGKHSGEVEDIHGLRVYPISRRKLA